MSEQVDTAIQSTVLSVVQPAEQASLPFLTVAQAAVHAHVSTKTIRRWLGRGQLQAQRFGSGAYLIAVEDLEAAQKAQQRLSNGRGHGQVVSSAVRRAIWERDHGICGICHNAVPFEETQIDHIIPLAIGGLANPDNLRATHGLCNARRSAEGLDTTDRSALTNSLDVVSLQIAELVRTVERNGLREVIREELAPLVDALDRMRVERDQLAVRVRALEAPTSDVPRRAWWRRLVFAG